MNVISMAARRCGATEQWLLMKAALDAAMPGGSAPHTAVCMQYMRYLTGTQSLQVTAGSHSHSKLQMLFNDLGPYNTQTWAGFSFRHAEAGSGRVILQLVRQRRNTPAASPARSSTARRRWSCRG